MGFVNVYCPFCGVVMQSDPYWESEHQNTPLIQKRPWYAEVRGLYKIDDIPGARTFITGVGIIRLKGRLLAPFDSSQSYRGTNIDDLDEWRICRADGEGWCFAFHHSCWKVLTCAAGYDAEEMDDEDVEDLAESVFSQLFCTPCIGYSVFKFGHDYAGAARTHSRCQRISPEDLALHYYADPCDIPSVEELENICPETPWPLKPLSDASEKQLSRSNVLSALPLEVLYEVLSYLHFRDILQLRLVSRSLRILADPPALPQSYWRSSFHPRCEHSFLFSLVDDEDTVDWRRLYIGVRTALNGGFTSLVNRKRIHLLLKPIVALITHGSPFSPKNRPHGLCLGPRCEKEKDVYPLYDRGRAIENRFLKFTAKSTRSFSGQVTSRFEDCPLTEGCREIHLTFLPLSGQSEVVEGLRIGISTVRIGARNFISGFNFFPDPDDPSEVGNLIGFRGPSSEEWIEMPLTNTLTALNVAICSEGLRAVQFVNELTSSRWIGDSDGPDISRGTLQIKSTSPQFLYLWLDHAKVVTVGLCQDYKGPEDETESDHTEEEPRSTS